VAEPFGVELRNSENPIAALGTSGSAHQPCPALSRGIGQGRVHNLYQLLIPSRKSHISTLAQRQPYCTAAANKKAEPVAPPLKKTERQLFPALCLPPDCLLARIMVSLSMVIEWLASSSFAF